MIKQWTITNRAYTFPRIVFDETHAQHFSPDSARAIELLRAEEGDNYDPEHLESVWFDKLISWISEDNIVTSNITAPLVLNNETEDVLFMVPANEDLSLEEKNSIKSFVNSGGSMLILSTVCCPAVEDKNSNFYQLFSDFGFESQPRVLRAFDGFENSEMFMIDIVGDHPATSESRIRVIIGHKLTATSNFAQIIETTQDLEVFEDANFNGVQDADEPWQTDVGIVGVSEYGAGRVVYISFHMFANDNVFAPNYDLIANAIKWLAEGVNTVATDVETVSEVPQTFKLSQNYPNPFNPRTTIEFEMPVTSYVSIKIYNIMGQEVATLVERSFEPGSYSIVWDGTSSSGMRVASGVYLYRFQAGDYREAKKLLILK